jgi:hypothetical protein
MALPRRRTHNDHDLPELPPLGDDDVDPALDVGSDLDAALDATSSLDDSAADELTIDELDAPEDTATDDADGPDDTGDDADEIDPDDRGGWTSDDAREPDDGSEIDELGELVADDLGLEGPDGEAPDELDALPPLDDDPEGDGYVGDGHDELPDLAAFALAPRAGATARLALGGASSVVAAASGLCAGRDRVYAVGDALAALSLSALDDADAHFEAVDGVEVDALFSSVLEDAAGGLWLGALSGDVWRKARARDAWRRVASLSEGRSTGAVELAREGRRVWALTALGTLHASDEGARFEPTLAREHVSSLAVDARGGVLAAVSGRRRDPLRASHDGGRAWSTLTLPDDASVRCVARASEVCAVACLAGPGYVSVDGGATWSAWPLLAGATALALIEADDGDARVFFSAHDEPSDRATLATARVGARAEALGACGLVDLTAVIARVDGDDDEPSRRVERVVALDRAGRHLALLTSRGAVVLVSLPA